MHEHIDRYYDVLIVGGGIAGLSMANGLSDSILKVAVIEKNEPQSVSDEFDSRVSAINASAHRFFKSTGVWQYMKQKRVSPFHKMFVWDSTGVGQIEFDCANSGLKSLGHIIENNVILQALRQKLEESENVDWLCPQSIKALDLTSDKHLVVLDNGMEISCRLLIGADGSNSAVRQAAKIDFERTTYDQLGIVSTVATEFAHDKTAWQCFLPSGPLAFLPLSDGRCSIVWSLEKKQAERTIVLDDKNFSRQLELAFEYKLGAITSASQRFVFPLSHGHVNGYVQQGLALIGDAAHTIHPLAGQGANLGILDAICLCDVIKQALDQNRSWHALHTLRRYERQRKGANLAMEISMSGFKTLFGNENAVMATLRNAGLNMVDRLPFIKNQLMQRALGL